jgi:hypothetical protein
MLSIEYRFIFIHIPKTAGTSITSILQELPARRFVRLQELLLFPRRVRPWHVRRHDTALNIRSKIGDDQFARFFKFAVVRNPWDLMVSSYFWWTQKATRWSVFDEDTRVIAEMNGFCEFARSHYGACMINEFRGDMLDLITDLNGRVIVDYVARFERLDDDMLEICRRIGVPYRPLPRANFTERKPYREYYDEETRNLIGWRFQREIALFGYEF